METTRGLPVWAAVTAGVLLAVVAVSYPDMAGWAWAAALGLSFAAVISLIWYRIMPLLIATTLSLAAGLAMAQAVPPWSIAVCGVAALVSVLVGRRMQRARPGLAVFAAGVAGALALSAVDGSAWINGLINLAIAVVVPWLAGQYLRQQAELAQAQARQARLQERARIAHDMHDSLGHELSLLALRAGALELDPQLQPHQRKAATQLRTGASTAIDRLAEIIGVIRAGEPAPLEPVTGGIPGLVRQAADAGLDATLEWSGPPELPSTVDRAAHRVVQEGLTNAAKHAPGAPVSVRVEHGEGTTTVTVTNGRAETVPRNGSGARMGLVALRERVESAGGTLRTGPRDGGFELRAQLPHRVAS